MLTAKLRWLSKQLKFIKKCFSKLIKFEMIL
jgi:hypothetical protein